MKKMVLLLVLFSVSVSAQVTMYETAPLVPALEDLPLQDSVSKDDITWTFSQPVRVGQFVNGDYYVVGPVTVNAIDPAPANGRHGSILNMPPTLSASGFDSRISLNRYEASLRDDPPISMQPGDSLVSSISLDEGETLPRPWRASDDCNSPVRSVSILTCLSEPVAPSAFRPSYLDTDNTNYYSHDMNRNILPTLPKVSSTPQISDYEDSFRRPWIDTLQFGVDVPCEYMPSYGREVLRGVSMASLLLMLDYSPVEKEPLLIYFMQYGIDLFGIVEAGHPGWPALGGHGNGRKMPIVFAGMLLGEDDMARVSSTHPGTKFSEDMQTMHDDCWTGADVVFAGHSGAAGHPNYVDRGAYEHLHPSQWPGTTGEGYRRCCTSIGFVGEAVTLHLMNAYDYWDHPAFFDYVDRWMTEDDSEHVQIIQQELGADYSASWSRQGQAWDAFVEEMWDTYRDLNVETCQSQGGYCCADSCSAPVSGTGCSLGETCCASVQDCVIGPMCGDSECQAGETCENCPEDCGACAIDCVHDADLPVCDGCVDTTELSAFINMWKSGSVEMVELMGVIGLWKNGC